MTAACRRYVQLVKAHVRLLVRHVCGEPILAELNELEDQRDNLWWDLTDEEREWCERLWRKCRRRARNHDI